MGFPVFLFSSFYYSHAPVSFLHLVFLSYEAQRSTRNGICILTLKRIGGSILYKFCRIEFFLSIFFILFFYSRFCTCVGSGGGVGERVGDYFFMIES